MGGNEKFEFAKVETIWRIIRDRGLFEEAEMTPVEEGDVKLASETAGFKVG